MEKESFIELLKTSEISNVTVGTPDKRNEFQTIEFCFGDQHFYLLINRYDERWLPRYFFHSAENEKKICPFCGEKNDGYNECSVNRGGLIGLFYEKLLNTKEAKLRLLLAGIKIPEGEGKNE